MTHLGRNLFTTGVTALASVSLLLGLPAFAADELTVSYMEAGTYDKAAEELAERFGQERGITVNVALLTGASSAPWSNT